MEKKLGELKNNFWKEIESIKDSKTLFDLKNKYLGRKGLLADTLKDLKDLAAEEKPKIGQIANQLKKS